MSKEFDDFMKTMERLEAPRISLQDAANAVCGFLPSGFIVRLGMENGAAWVELVGSDGNKTDIDGGGSSLYEQLNEAVSIACGFDC